MYANAIYLRRLRNLVADSARKPDDEQLHWLRRRGGINWLDSSPRLAHPGDTGRDDVADIPELHRGG